MFADGTSLTATGESSFEIEYKLGVEIQNVKTWLDSNKLTLNEEKTEYMLIGSGKRLKQIRNDPIIKIRDHIIKRGYRKKVLRPKQTGRELPTRREFSVFNGI